MKKYSTRQITRSNGHEQLDTQCHDVSGFFESAVELLELCELGIDVSDVGAELFGHSENEIIVGRLHGKDGDLLDAYLVQVMTEAGE